jgi:DNA-binding PadR family transcriptional regulator
MMTSKKPADVLPLRPVVFGILTVLRQAPLHGYGIMQRANDHVGHRALLGPGTLYRTLKELRGGGMIEHTDAPGGTDARRQYYQLTPFGDEVAVAEAQRLGRLIETAELAGQQAG